MPKLTPEIPDRLRPYTSLGLELFPVKEQEVVTDCPLCGRERKMFISAATGLYSCKTCNPDPASNSSDGGNSLVFVRRLHQYSLETTTKQDYEELAHDRKLRPDWLQEWSLCKSAVNGLWLFPTFNDEKEVCNLYRWEPDDKGRRVLKGVATFAAALFGLQFWVKSRPTAYITEGPWDGIALWGALAMALKGYIRELRDLPKNNVVAVPGRNTFKDDWMPRFKGKDVTLLYDNDYDAGGTQSMQKVAGKLTGIAATIKRLNWGAGGFDCHKPDGWDVRDILTTEDPANYIVENVATATVPA